MALVTVQRSPSPSQSGTEQDEVEGPSCSEGSRTSGRQKRSRATSLVKRCINSMRFISRIRFSESYFTVKGAALILPNAEACKRKISKASHGGDIQNHLQAMCHLLRPQDTLQVAVKLESVYAHGGARYFAVVSCNGRQDTEESVVLGLDCTDDSKNACIGLVLPVWANTRTTLNGDGGFTVCTANERTHIFKPVTVQAMWSGLHVLHKVCDNANTCCYVPSGLTHTWISYYESKMEFADPVAIGEWNMTDDLIAAVKCGEGSSARPSAVCGQEDLEKQIRIKLREIVIRMDLDDVTSVYLRQQLEAALHVNLKSYKSFIDEEMIVVMGQLDSPSRIFDFLYLGSEWNASNLEELQMNGIGYILNVTKEIDNFFPGLFKYHNVRVHDTEDTDLLRHWEATHKFILRAIEANSKVLVHCKMGVSRSASTVIAFAMKQFNWSFDKAHEYVLTRRSVVRPNDGFWHQLQLYEGILKASNQRHSELWRSKSESNLKAIQRSLSLQTVANNDCGSSSIKDGERHADGCGTDRSIALERIGSTADSREKCEEASAGGAQGADVQPAPAGPLPAVPAGTLRPRSWSSRSVDKDHERLTGVKSASCLQELDSSSSEARGQGSSANSRCGSSCGDSSFESDGGSSSSAFSDGEAEATPAVSRRQCYDLTSMSSAITSDYKVVAASDAAAAAMSPAADGHLQMESDDCCFAVGGIRAAFPTANVSCDQTLRVPAVDWPQLRTSCGRSNADPSVIGTAATTVAAATDGFMAMPHGHTDSPASRGGGGGCSAIKTAAAAAVQPPVDLVTSRGVDHCGGKESRGGGGGSGGQAASRLGQAVTRRPTCLDGPWRRRYALESIPWSAGAVRRHKDALECEKALVEASEAAAAASAADSAASRMLPGPAFVHHATVADAAAAVAGDSSGDFRGLDPYSADTGCIDSGQPTPGTVKKVRREFEERVFADETGFSLATRGCTVQRSSSLKGLAQLPSGSPSPTAALQRSASVRERRSAACIHKGSGAAGDGRGIGMLTSPLARPAASCAAAVAASPSVHSAAAVSSATRVDALWHEGHSTCCSEAVRTDAGASAPHRASERGSSVSPVASGVCSSSEEVRFFLGATQSDGDSQRFGDRSKRLQGSLLGAASLCASNDKVEQHQTLIEQGAAIRLGQAPVKLRTQGISPSHFVGDSLCTPSESDVCTMVCSMAQSADDRLSPSQLRQTSSVKNLVGIFEAGWRNTWSGKEDSSCSGRLPVAAGCSAAFSVQEASPLCRARSFCVSQRAYPASSNSQAVAPAEVAATAAGVRLRSKQPFSQRHRVSSASGTDASHRSARSDAGDGRSGFVPSRAASLHVVAQ